MADPAQLQGETPTLLCVYVFITGDGPARETYGKLVKTRTEAIDFLRTSARIPSLADPAVADSAFSFAVRERGSLKWIPDVAEVWRSVMDHHVRTAAPDVVLEIVVELTSEEDEPAPKDEPDPEPARESSPARPPSPQAPAQPSQPVVKPEREWHLFHPRRGPEPLISDRPGPDRCITLASRRI